MREFAEERQRRCFDNANFREDYLTTDENRSIGGPYYRTEDGEFENSDSRYGTIDQGGNLWVWNESING